MTHHIWKRFSSLVLITLMVGLVGTTTGLAAEWEGYDDVSKDNVHYEGILALTEQGVFTGYESNQFKPWEHISREHMAVILSKVQDYDEPENIKETLMTYKDVDDESRYAKEIAMLTEAKVFKGDEDGNFNPRATITRQQMATVLVYAMSLDRYDQGENVEINLDNVSLSHKENVQTLANLGLTSQRDDFRSYEPITRAAVATFVYKAQAVDKEPGDASVKPGIEVLLDDHLDWLDGKRVGLITNPTGVSRNLESDIDLLNEHPDVNLTALYGPEHGIRADREAGEHVDSYIDEKTGLPVHSLYGSTWKPTEEMLEDVDVLLFDIQDIGSNVYTYIYTLGFAMEAAAEQDKELVVLDRPNAIGGTKVEGPVRSKDAVSFMGRFLLPVRHGMTVGELATMWNQEYSLGANLKVAEMDGWKRTMHFEDTGLPWVMPSPNIPTEDSANLYAGTELLDDTSLSVGLGTTRPFELIGAPWIDAEELAEEMNDRDLEGLTFRPAHFTPKFGEYKDELTGGVQIHLDNPNEVNLVELGLNLIDAMRDQNPEKFEMSSSYTNLIGDAEAADMVREGQPVEEIIGSWEDELDYWVEEVRNNYLLYPPYPNEGETHKQEGVLGILPFDLSAAPGEAVDLDVIGYDEKGEKLKIDPSDINWRVSDDVGYVEDGQFHAEQEGQGEMTATYGDYQAKRDVNVSSTLIDAIRLGVHSDYTRVVFDLNKTITNYKIDEKKNSLNVTIPYGEINGDLEEDGGTIDVKDSPVISSIDYSVEEENFIAVFNLKKESIEYMIPDFAAKLVIDLDH